MTCDDDDKYDAKSIQLLQYGRRIT